MFWNKEKPMETKNAWSLKDSRIQRSQEEPYVGEYAIISDTIYHPQDGSKIPGVLSWTKFKHSDILDEHEGSVKIQTFYNCWMNQKTEQRESEPVWVKKSDLFYYSDIYKPLREKIERRLK